MATRHVARFRYDRGEMQHCERMAHATVSRRGDSRSSLGGLRYALRQGTRAQHARVDSLYGGIPLETRAGLKLFLRAHAIALAAIEHELRTGHPDTGCPLDQSLRAQRDLAVLGDQPPASVIFIELRDAHPWGLAYVIAGAHLGAKILCARWRKSQDPAVLQAGAYLSSTSMKTYWPKLLMHLAALEPTPAEEESILGGANAAFAVFESALGVAMKTTSAEA